MFFLAIGFFNKDRFVAPTPSLPPQEASAVGGSSVNPILPIASTDRDDFSAIVDAMGPAVVNISTRRTAKEAPTQAPAGEGEADPFAPFFGPEEGPGPEAPAEGLGSGFIIAQDGIILTNAHVVDGADEVSVRLRDQREFPAKVMGVDRLSDTAVLKVDGQNLPIIPIGASPSIRVGEWVVAIGSPFGFDNTVTAGIVSATARSLPEEGYVPFIQTDVAVNPGNSGGPLINTRGEVIGINSQIVSKTGGYQGLSFAIPMDVALHVKEELLANGRVSRGKLGVSVQDLSQGLAESFGLSTPDGALVGMVTAKGPADLAGLKAGDIILEMNGIKVTDSRSLPPKVALLKPGSLAHISLWRDGKILALDIKVVELEDTSRGVEPQVPSNPTTADHLGLGTRPLSPDELKDLGLDGGVLVEQRWVLQRKRAFVLAISSLPSMAIGFTIKGTERT
ncbi:MAG: PDZ domain-containing protein, partial [Gammaproteobacteria bacterium]|nr:PDZ domain-containing protein [Gammaproteobacteria bacterium]